MDWAALDVVTGGNDEEGGGGQEAAPEAPPAEYDNASAEPAQNFDTQSFETPEVDYPTEAPQIDTTGVTPQYDDQQLADNRAAMFGDGQYQDGASPEASFDGSPAAAADPAYGEHTNGPAYGDHTAGPSYGDPAGQAPAIGPEQQRAADPIDPVQAINSMVPLPEYPTEAPYIEPSGTPAQPSFEAQVDIAQHYQDLASPSELQQGQRGDCFNVAALNVLNAENPGYLQSLTQETRREGIYNVSTLDRQGNPHDVYVRDTPIRNGATTDDPALQSVYNATSLLYHPGKPGGSPADAMERVGADAGQMSPLDAVAAHQNGEGGAVLGTWDQRSLANADPSVQQGFRDANLYDGHAYQVASVIRNESDGRDYAVLRNPWQSGTPENPGSVHPRPIPVEDLDKYFSSGFAGTTRR